MSFLQQALALADMGFHVFPLIPNSKLPLIDDFPNQATTDHKRIKQWWIDPIMELEQPYNIGISTSKFGTGGALVVVDSDVKKNGEDTVFELELTGKELPPTFTQITASGGSHRIYWSPKALKQGTDVLGKGLDIRSKGGYIVGAGSEIDGKEYTSVKGEIMPCPDWVAEACGQAHEKKKKSGKEIKTTAAAIDRAKHYLINECPAAESGSRNQSGYKAACKVKDYGVDQDTALQLLLDHWKCEPMLEHDEVEHVVNSAYRYGNEEPGAASPEIQFSPVGEEVIEQEQLSYLQKMNKEYALIYMEGSHFILHETIDEKGRPKRVFLTEQTFKRRFSPYTIQKNSTYAEEWLDWKHRREYKGVCFAPEREARHGYYNLWRGFTCQPLAYEHGSREAKAGFDMFLAHARENICRGDNELFTWLMGYFAHMVQRPFERPLTTVVFRGGKGTGKNALVDRVGNLMGSGHYLVAHDGRYLTSNFNAHFDSCLCLVLDEAFWSGDKAAEGKLKGLTTAPEIIIERKGREPYMVDNLVRLIVIGNEKWLVPASADERRYAVYDVGDGRKQDRKFFHDMRVFIDEMGGNQILLHYLQNFDLSKVDVNYAPRTAALLDQKVSSLEPFHQFWFDCLSFGKIVNSDFACEWEGELDVDKERFRMAFGRYCRDKNIRSRIPDDRSIGKQLKGLCPDVDPTKKKREGSELINLYRLPSLEHCRKAFGEYMGQAVIWE